MTAATIALYALVLAAPLAIGSVHATTQVVLAAVALALFIVVAIGPLREKGVRVPPPFAWIGFAAFAWTALQLVPLPLAVLRLVSPHAAVLREETGARFAPITLDVAATQLELCKLFAAIVVVLLGAELLRNGTRRCAEILGTFGALAAVLVWTHRLTGATKIYGFYEPHSLPGSGLFAPFVNGNNEASLLALCALAAAGAAFGRNDTRGPLYGAFAFLAGGSVLGTTSRGGAIGLAAGALFLGAALASERFGRVRAIAISIGVVVTLAVGSLVIAKELRGRFVAQSPGASLTDNQKTRGWLAGLRLADTYPLTGVGRGAFEAPAASVRGEDEGVRLVYPENVVMQLASEWGWPIALALLGALVAGFATTLARSKLDGARLGLAAAVIAVAVHELFDFGLEFPGIALPVTLALSALVAGAETDDHSRRPHRPRIQGARFVAFVLVGAAVVLGGNIARGRTLAVDLDGATDLEAAIRRHPASAELEILAAEQAISKRAPGALHHLNRAMLLQPSAARPHVLAMVELEQLHRYRQAALEYRLARDRGAEFTEEVLIQHLGRYAIDAEPQRVDAYVRLGAAYAAYKRYDDATRVYERAAELDPGPKPREAWLLWMSPERRPAVLEVMEKSAQDAGELGIVISAWTELKNYDRAEHAFASGTTRYPDSAAIAVAGARMRMARGDLEGARKAIGFTSRFALDERLHAEEVLVDIAQRSGDLDQVAAARARIRFLRAKLHMEEPANGGIP